MCPHGRQHWQMCPWCTGINSLPPPSPPLIEFTRVKTTLDEEQEQKKLMESLIDGLTPDQVVR
jgi:hypothetical protein